MKNSETLRLIDIQDEMTVTSESLDLQGVYADENIREIRVNGEKAELGVNSFSISGVDVPSKENDIVVKAYGKDGEIL